MRSLCLLEKKTEHIFFIIVTMNHLEYMCIFLLICCVVILLVKHLRKTENFVSGMIEQNISALQESACSKQSFYKPDMGDLNFVNGNMIIGTSVQTGKNHGKSCIGLDKEHLSVLECPSVNCIRADDTSRTTEGVSANDIVGNGLENETVPQCGYDDCVGFCETIDDLCYVYNPQNNTFDQTRGRMNCVPERLNTQQCLKVPLSNLCEDKYLFKYDEYNQLTKIPQTKGLNSLNQCVYSSNDILEPYYLTENQANNVCKGIPETSLCYYKRSGDQMMDVVDDVVDSEDKQFYVKIDHPLLKPDCRYEEENNCLKSLDGECADIYTYFKYKDTTVVDEETVHVNYDTFDKKQYLWKVDSNIDQCVTPVNFPPEGFSTLINCSKDCIHPDGSPFTIEGKLTISSNDSGTSGAVCELVGVDSCFSGAENVNWIKYNPGMSRHTYGGYHLGDEQLQVSQYMKDTNYQNTSLDVERLNPESYFTFMRGSTNKKIRNFTDIVFTGPSDDGNDKNKNGRRPTGRGIIGDDIDGITPNVDTEIENGGGGGGGGGDIDYYTR